MNHSLLNPSVSKYWTLPLATLGIRQGATRYCKQYKVLLTKNQKNRTTGIRDFLA